MKNNNIFFFVLFSLLSFLCVLSVGAKNIQIDSIEEFTDFAQAVNNGDEAYGKAYVILTKDLDFTNKEFVPVGTAENPFEGIFNGGGHILSGITIDSYDETYVKTTKTVTNGKEQILRSASVGVFAYLHNASVYNLGVSDMTINITAYENDTVCAGMLVGSFFADNSGETFSVKHCFADGSLNVICSGGSAYAGGLLGNVYDTDTGVAFHISDCYADASLSATAKNTVRCGGIVAALSVKKVFSTATLENLRFGGSIYGKGLMSCLGGICGFAAVDNSWGAGDHDWSQEIIPGKIINVVTDTAISASSSGSVFKGSVVGYSNTIVPENAYAVNVVNNSSYSFGGEEISRSKLSDVEFMTQVVKFNMDDLWCIYDEKPVLKYICTPDRIEITNVKYSADSLIVTAEYNGFSDAGTILCAVFSSDGRMLEVHTKALENEENFVFALHTDASYAKVFLFGDKVSLNPLCNENEYEIK